MTPAGEPTFVWPVESIPTDEPDAPPSDITGLCLSGGGVRAMLFHLGGMWRLNELGMLRSLGRVSSVSGGSITAGVLATRWRDLRFDERGVATNFRDLVVAPIRRFAGRDLDVMCAVRGALLPGQSSAECYASALREHLYGDATLQDLPSDADGPRFIFNATNLQSGALWRFSRPYAWDWRVGRIDAPTFSVATAVAASGAFPPFFAPLELHLDPDVFVPGSGSGLEDAAYRRLVRLADGGAYDNLGLETVFKRCRSVLVSDGGGKLSDDPTPATDWIRGTLRVMTIIDNQVRSLRKRLLIAAYDRGDRDGAYWGIRSAIADYPVTGVLPCPPEATRVLAEMPTRLAKVPAARQRALVDWGYAIADAALRYRGHVPDSAPAAFPYPGGLG